jgi:hypothetical protein
MGWVARLRPSPALVLAMVAVVIAMRGVAIGSVPDSSGKISACYGKNGTLRIVDTSKKGKCARGEHRISWNQKGAVGIPGPRGATGAAGAAGTPGSPGAPGGTHAVIRYQEFTSDMSGFSGHVRVTCNAGERALGGGIGWTNSPGASDTISYSGPDDGAGLYPDQGSTPVGWAGEIKTSDLEGKTGRVYAVCVSP